MRKDPYYTFSFNFPFLTAPLILSFHTFVSFSPPLYLLSAALLLFLLSSISCCLFFRIHFKIILFAFKALNGLAPPYLSELLHPYTHSRSLRSADQLLLTVPEAGLKLRGDRAFAVAAPKLWNGLPLHIRQASSLSHFKSILKTHLFSLAFDTM